VRLFTKVYLVAIYVKFSHELAVSTTLPRFLAPPQYRPPHIYYRNTWLVIVR
jgi:hypothetical protein